MKKAMKIAVPIVIAAGLAAFGYVSYKLCNALDSIGDLGSLDSDDCCDDYSESVVSDSDSVTE